MVRKIDLSGDFLSAKSTDPDVICTIIGSIEISELSSGEGPTKTVLNLPIDYKGEKKTYTPNKATMRDFVAAWTDDIDLWEGKKFKTVIVKDPKNTRFPIKLYGEPVKDDTPVKKVVAGEEVAEVKI